MTYRSNQMPLSHPQMERPMTPDQLVDIKMFLARTWQAIAHDVMEGNEGEAMPRMDVIEVVLDSGYLEMYGPRDGVHKAEKASDLEIIKLFRALPHSEQDKIALSQFRYNYYS